MLTTWPLPPSSASLSAGRIAVRFREWGHASRSSIGRDEPWLRPTSDLTADRPLVFRDGIVLTMDRGGTILERGDVLVVGDTIEAVGESLEVPEGTAEIDASGASSCRA
jgi:hypothetical protein